MLHDSMHFVQEPAKNKNSVRASVLSHDMCSVFSMDVNLWLYAWGMWGGRVGWMPWPVGGSVLWHWGGTGVTGMKRWWDDSQGLNKTACLPVRILIFFICSHQIARLREEGSRQLEEQQRIIREQIQREREAQQSGGYTHRNVSLSKIQLCPICPNTKKKTLKKNLQCAVKSIIKAEDRTCLKWSELRFHGIFTP